VFTIVYPFDRDRSIISKSQTAVIDTIRIADAFRTDPVDVAGVEVVAREGDTADVAIIFRQDRFDEGVIDQARKALRRHSDGGTPAETQAEIHTTVRDDADPERRDPEMMIEW